MQAAVLSPLTEGSRESARTGPRGHIIMPAYVLASGRPPCSPAAFDYSNPPPGTFDPPLKREAPKKVLSSGRVPQPPPAFDALKSPGKFQPPIDGAKPAPVCKLVPKYLASGLLPQPPPAITEQEARSLDFDPPVTFAPSPDS